MCIPLPSLGRPTSRHGDRVVVLNDEAHHCWERAADAKTTRRNGTNQGVWMQAIHELDNLRIPDEVEHRFRTKWNSPRPGS